MNPALMLAPLGKLDAEVLGEDRKGREEQHRRPRGLDAPDRERDCETRRRQADADAESRRSRGWVVSIFTVPSIWRGRQGLGIGRPHGTARCHLEAVTGAAGEQQRNRTRSNQSEADVDLLHEKTSFLRLSSPGSAKRPRCSAPLEDSSVRFAETLPSPSDQLAVRLPSPESCFVASRQSHRPSVVST